MEDEEEEEEEDMFAQLSNNQEGGEDASTITLAAPSKSRNSINIKNINGKTVDVHQEASQRLEELESGQTTQLKVQP